MTDTSQNLPLPQRQTAPALSIPSTNRGYHLNYSQPRCRTDPGSLIHLRRLLDNPQSRYSRRKAQQYLQRQPWGCGTPAPKEPATDDPADSLSCNQDLKMLLKVTNRSPDVLYSACMGMQPVLPNTDLVGSEFSTTGYDKSFPRHSEHHNGYPMALHCSVTLGDYGCLQSPALMAGQFDNTLSLPQALDSMSGQYQNIFTVVERHQSNPMMTMHGIHDNIIAGRNLNGPSTGGHQQQQQGTAMIALPFYNRPFADEPFQSTSHPTFQHDGRPLFEEPQSYVEDDLNDGERSSGESTLIGDDDLALFAIDSYYFPKDSFAFGMEENILPSLKSSGEGGLVSSSDGFQEATRNASGVVTKNPNATDFITDDKRQPPRRQWVDLSGTPLSRLISARHSRMAPALRKCSRRQSGPRLSASKKSKTATKRISVDPSQTRSTFPKVTEGPYKCDKCGQVFATRSAKGNWLRHLRHQHTLPAERPKQLWCGDCKKSFNRFDALQTHREKYNHCKEMEFDPEEDESNNA